MVSRWVVGITALAWVWAWGNLAQPVLTSALDFDLVHDDPGDGMEAAEAPWYRFEPGYIRLQQALDVYRQIAADRGWATIPQGAYLTAG